MSSPAAGLFYDPRVVSRPAPLTHNPLLALVAPRPIAWISTMDRTGRLNLAPFSHFNIVSVDPPMVMFAPNSKDEAGAPKDTLRNVGEVPEFVVNVVSWEQREQMNATSKILPFGESEFALAGVEPKSSVSVRPPRVADSKAALECRVWRVVELPSGRSKRNCHIVIGEVVGIHISPDIIVDGRICAQRLAQISRLGYFDYLVVQETFEMRRPDGPE